jgi:hypothetical protein
MIIAPGWERQDARYERRFIAIASRTPNFLSIGTLIGRGHNQKIPCFQLPCAGS